MACCAFLFPGILEAADVTTIQSGLWSDPLVWSTGVVPVNGDDVTISTDVTLDINSAPLHSLHIVSGSLVCGTSTLDISGPTTGTAAGGLTLDGGLLSFTNGSLNLAYIWNTSSGTFDPGTGSVTIGGPDLLTIAGPLSFFNLTVTNDLRLRDRITVRGSLINQDTLYGGTSTIILEGVYSGGYFIPEQSTFVIANKSLTTLSSALPSHYYDLVLADSSMTVAARDIVTDIKVDHAFLADFRASLSSGLQGQGKVNVGGSFTYIGPSVPNWQSAIVLDSGVKNASLDILPLARGAAFAFPGITVAKPDTTYVLHVRGNDSLFISSDVEIVGGTLDLERGLVVPTVTRSPISGPFVHVHDQARFMTARKDDYDSSSVAYFKFDTLGAVEFYADSIIDVSYFLGNVVGHQFGSLRLGHSITARARQNPLSINGPLYIGIGATLYPSYGDGPVMPDSIVISNDVVNANRGESASVGAGTDGDGMTIANERWIFDRANDTIHWSGPSELASIFVRNNTILSVRFADHSHCDSLYYRDSITEENGSCGGSYILGRVFTAPQALLAGGSRSSFGNIGLDIVSGDNPPLGVVRVSRTAGYLPPSVRSGIAIDNTVHRYYQVSSQFGPQQGLPNQLYFHYRCDEQNGAELRRLRFWKSFDRGVTWFQTGVTSDPQLDSASFTLRYDTNSLGSRDQLWTLSDQLIDQSLPVELKSFSAKQNGSAIELRWQTASEIACEGFEIDAVSNEGATQVASFVFDPELRSKSRYGAAYKTIVPIGRENRFDLYERSADGSRVLLGSAMLEVTANELSTNRALAVYPNPIGHAGTILLEADESGLASFQLSDEIGRVLTTWTVTVVQGSNELPFSIGQEVPRSLHLLATVGGRKMHASIITRLSP